MDKKKEKIEGTPLSPEKLYTIDQLAKSIGISAHTLRTKAREGKIPAVKHFGRFYFLGKEVIEHILNEGKRKE